MRAFLFVFVLSFVPAAAQSQTDYTAKAKGLVDQMTLEEKASLFSGETAWTTKAIKRLGIPSVFMTDGPHGLRKAEGFDFTNSVPATCFPTAPGLAASWNTELVEKVGKALGEECQANDVQFLLGPGINMKRSPLGGRNFEYFSEDPFLSGKMAVALIRGIQSEGVGTSLKHFAVNNQEYERMSNNSVLDERTLREIYLPAFELAVKEAAPWTVMCSYNRINGTLGSENHYLLTDVLRKEWGFKGFVVSDWGAVDNRVAGVNAGLNLEMPSSGGLNDKKIVEAVKNGQISEQHLNDMTVNLLAGILMAKDAHKAGATYDADKHHQLAREVAGECIVLLKNKGNILPITALTQKVAVIGAFAKTPRYQGAGSSQVRPTKLSNPFDELKALVGKTQLTYAAGYKDDGSTDAALLAEAARVARGAQVVVVFAGLPAVYESEGYDRKNMDLPEGHNQLIEAIAKANPNVVVVLQNGSAVAMPWESKVKGIVEGWLGGQAGGGALADILTGKVNPSAKLTETFPVSLNDTPTALTFPGQGGTSLYGEGIYIGYRWYDKKQIKPLFPFGYGLSYTSFAFSNETTSREKMKDTDELTVEVTVKNTGKVAGKEVVQLYVHEQAATVSRPENELKQFAKVALNPGEQKTVTFKLSYRDFAYYSTEAKDWKVNTGKFDIRVGSSSRDLPLEKTVEIEATKIFVPTLDRNSLMKQFKVHPRGSFVYQQMLQGIAAPGMDPNSEQAKKQMAFFEIFLLDMPISKMVSMSGGRFTEDMLNAMLKQVNERP